MITLLATTTGCATTRQNAALALGTVGVLTTAGGVAVIADRPERQPGDHTSAAPEAMILGGALLTAAAVGLLVNELDPGGRRGEAWSDQALSDAGSYDSGADLGCGACAGSGDSAGDPPPRRSARAERGEDRPSHRAAEPTATPAPQKRPSDDVRSRVPNPPPPKQRGTSSLKLPR